MTSTKTQNARRAAMSTLPQYCPRDVAMPADGRNPGDERRDRGRDDRGMSPLHRKSTPAAAVPQPPNAPVLTPAQPAATAAAPAEPARAINDDSTFVRGEQYQNTIANMMEMGFERDQVVKALRAAFNHPDRAVEYLFNVCLT